MINIKGNYKSQHNNLNCRWCTHTKESQKQCVAFKDLTKTIETYSTYFENDNKSMAETAEIINGIIERIEAANTN